MKIPGKGTVLEIDIAGVYTPVAQILSAEVGEVEFETYEGRTLDQLGVGMDETPTGYAAGNEISGEFFLDPDLPVHALMFSKDPFTHFGRAGVLTLPDGDPANANAGATGYAFVTNRIGCGLTVAMNDGIKAPFTVGLKEPGTLTPRSFDPDA